MYERVCVGGVGYYNKLVLLNDPYYCLLGITKLSF